MYKEYMHNLEMLNSLVNSKVQSEKVIRLIAIRTQIANDEIQGTISYACKNVDSPVYERLMSLAQTMKDELNKALIKG